MTINVKKYISTVIALLSFLFCFLSCTQHSIYDHRYEIFDSEPITIDTMKTLNLNTQKFWLFTLYTTSGYSNSNYEKYHKKCKLKYSFCITKDYKITCTFLDRKSIKVLNEEYEYFRDKESYVISFIELPDGFRIMRIGLVTTGKQSDWYTVPWDVLIDYQQD